MIHLLKRRNFRYLFLANFVSAIGDMVLLIALPFHVYNITGSTAATGFTFIIQALPRLVLGSVAAVFVDHWDRRRTMVFVDLSRALVLLPLLLVRSADGLWLIYVVGITKSTIGVFFGPAYNAFLPQLVAKDDLIAANSLSSVTQTIIRLVGPTLGGALLAISGLTWVVLLDVASYVGSALMLLLIRLDSDQQISDKKATVQKSGAKLSGRIVNDWLEGLRAVRENRVLSGVIVVSGVAMLAQGMINVLLVPFVKEMLKGGSLEFGWIATAQGIGTLAGGLLIGRMGKKWRPSLVVSLGLLVVAIIFFAMIHFPTLVVALILIALLGAPSAIYTIQISTLLQSSVSDEYRGRSFGFYSTVITFTMLTGMGAVSVLGDRVQLLTLLDIAGGLYLVAAAVAFVMLGTSGDKEADETPAAAEKEPAESASLGGAD